MSRGSLAKAESLLEAYVEDGRAVGVLGDGFFGVPKDTQQVLIAGMGGSEIISILSDEKYGFLPERFVFQPMHDQEKLRRYIVEKGGYIERDFTFQDVKYYDVIVGGRRVEGMEKPSYTDAEYEFGKDNLREMGEAFVSRTEKLLKDIDRYLARENLQKESKADLERRKARLRGVLSGEIK